MKPGEGEKPRADPGGPPWAGGLEDVRAQAGTAVLDELPQAGVVVEVPGDALVLQHAVHDIVGRALGRGRGSELIELIKSVGLARVVGGGAALVLGDNDLVPAGWDG